MIIVCASMCCANCAQALAHTQVAAAATVDVPLVGHSPCLGKATFTVSTVHVQRVAGSTRRPQCCAPRVKCQHAGVGRDSCRRPLGPYIVHHCGSLLTAAACSVCWYRACGCACIQSWTQRPAKCIWSKDAGSDWRLWCHGQPHICYKLVCAFWQA
jgi:hypothetical protein